MIALDPSKRISVKEALKHPYFEDLKAEDIAKYEYVSQNNMKMN